MPDQSDLDSLRSEFKEGQSTTTFPENLPAGRSVDEFLWEGDPKATPVQRVGLFIFGPWFLFFFLGFVAFAIFDHDWLIKLIGLSLATLSGILGCRPVLNALRHSRPHRKDR
jgi:hypothetical protein